MPHTKKIMRLLASLEELPGVADDTTLSALLQRALAERRLSFRAAEEEIGVNRTTLSQIAAGTYPYQPDPPTAEALAKFLGRTPAEIRELAAARHPHDGGESAELAARIGALRPGRRAIVSYVVTSLLAEQDAEITAEQANRVALRLLQAAVSDPEHAKAVGRLFRRLRDRGDIPEHMSELSPALRRSLTQALMRP